MLKKKYNTSKTLIIYAPFIDIGGIEKNLVILTNYLTKNISKLTLVTWRKKDKKLFNKKVKIVNPDIFFSKINNRYIKNFIGILILIKLIVRNKNCIIFSLQSNLYVTLIAKIFNIKNIIRIASYGWMLSRIKKIIFYFILKLPTEIIVNSLEMKKILKNQININSICIYNPLNKLQILNEKKTNKKFFSDQKNMKILFLGRFVDVKDPITFLKGLKELDREIDYEALMVGNGGMKKTISRYIDNFDLGRKVKIISEKKNAMQILDQCDLLILTSKFEGLPNVLIEAQYLKKYIISTNCKTGPKEILASGKYGTLINIGDYHNLKNKIEYFYRNRNKKKIKKKIRDGFNDLYRFDYIKNCQKFENIIFKYL